MLEEASQQPKSDQNPSSDLSRGRINQLKSIVKNFIFNDSASQQDFLDEGLTTKAADVCHLVATTLKKLLPKRTKYHILFYQIFFCIFANDVLHHTQHQKFSRKLCPSKTASHTNALRVDGPSLYQLLTTKTLKYTAIERFWTYRDDIM